MKKRNEINYQKIAMIALEEKKADPVKKIVVTDV